MKTVGDFVNALLKERQRWRRLQILGQVPPHLRPEVERLVRQLWPLRDKQGKQDKRGQP
ncbi:MAG: hypothetical protein HQL47_09705 [Gammaproteobacteria bacterium]|nr:hypothetical protein [Gammaproteobacteria bacterium]